MPGDISGTQRLVFSLQHRYMDAAARMVWRGLDAGAHLQQEANVELHAHDQSIQAQHCVLAAFIHPVAQVHVRVDPGLVAQHYGAPTTSRTFNFSQLLTMQSSISFVLESKT